jgi:hypothetical protein
MGGGGNAGRGDVALLRGTECIEAKSRKSFFTVLMVL